MSEKTLTEKEEETIRYMVLGAVKVPPLRALLLLDEITRLRTETAELKKLILDCRPLILLAAHPGHGLPYATNLIARIDAIGEGE